VQRKRRPHVNRENQRRRALPWLTYHCPSEVELAALRQQRHTERRNFV